jgi:hypothetical protein
MPQLSKKDLAREYEHFRFGSGGLGNFVHEKMDDEVFHQLRRLDQTPLTKVQLNRSLCFQMPEACRTVSLSTIGSKSPNIPMM